MTMIKLQISSGQGPRECEAAVGHYLKQLQTEYSSLQVLQSKCGHYKETYTFVICEIEESEIKDKRMTGSILWICPSPYRPNHKRKNWYIDVSFVKEGHELVSSGEIGISYQTFRSGGKGGQHVNKVETGVRAIHKETGISVVSTEARSQHMNKQIATSRLLNLLAERNRKSEAEDKKFLWLEQQQIERGNPIRIFKGEEFREISK